MGFSTAITCFWAFWGILENFHEGWYYADFLPNVGLMVVQYLSPMLVFMSVTLISVLWPRTGAALHMLFALLMVWFFHALTNTVLLFLIAPLIGIGVLYWFGLLPSRRVALAVTLGLPFLTLILFGIGPALRVSRRLDDGDRQARRIAGHGVELIWAPDGPGWPQRGMTWYKAQQICDHLGEDGLTVEATPQAIWRLPTVDEAVRSMARHGENSGGIWEAEAVVATYDVKPDKESPLWHVHAPVIYWWTASEVDGGHAYIIVYDGKVWPRSKQFGAAYLGFRCVRDP